MPRIAPLDVAMRGAGIAIPGRIWVVEWQGKGEGGGVVWVGAGLLRRYEAYFRLLKVVMRMTL